MPADTPAEKLALAAIDADLQITGLISEGNAKARIPFSKIYAYVNDPNFTDTDDFEKSLAKDQAAQTDLDRLLEKSALLFMPKLAAASSGSVTRRETDDALITLTPSRAEPDQLYLQIEMKDLNAFVPTRMYARLDNTPWLRLNLPSFVNAKAQVLLSAGDKIAQIIAAPDGEVYLR